MVKPEEWAEVVTVLNRGGRFEDPGAEYVGSLLKSRLNGQALFYDEKTAGAKHSYTGQYFDGLPKYESVRTYDMKEVEQSEPLQFLNWNARNVGTHRTINDVWLREIKSENFLWMNPIDADRRGLQDGDKVKIKSDHIEVVGHIMVTGGIRPGTVGTSYNYGNTAYGGKSAIIDGKSTPVMKPSNHTPFIVKKPLEQKTGYALGRDTEFSGNGLLVVIDPKLKNTSLLDLIGGGSRFARYQSRDYTNGSLKPEKQTDVQKRPRALRNSGSFLISEKDGFMTKLKSKLGIAIHILAYSVAKNRQTVAIPLSLRLIPP